MMHARRRGRPPSKSLESSASTHSASAVTFAPPLLHRSCRCRRLQRILHEIQFVLSNRCLPSYAESECGGLPVCGIWKVTHGSCPVDERAGILLHSKNLTILVGWTGGGRERGRERGREGGRVGGEERRGGGREGGRERMRGLTCRPASSWGDENVVPAKGGARNRCLSARAVARLPTRPRARPPARLRTRLLGLLARPRARAPAHPPARGGLRGPIAGTVAASWRA